MKKVITLLSFSFLIQLQVNAQVNYSEHIASIIYNNCTSCHRAGEIAPFPLTNYQEVSSWGEMIQYVTETKYMPPWKPDKSYSHFVGESGLTDAEIQMIADWVAAGTPQGNPSLEPALPDFPSGSQLGTPDLVLEMSEEYLIEGNNEDDYRVFVLPTGLTEDKEIAAIEFRPGNTRAVHHALLAYETRGQAAAADAETPEYGYEAFGTFGVQTQGSFTGYTPGIKTVFFPKGIGTILPAGADLLMQIHYAPLPSDETDRSLLNIFFKEEDDVIEREIQRIPITPRNLSGGFSSFSLPPEEVKTFHGMRTVTEDISVISVYPHCHYLGRSWELFAETPMGDTINIIRIKDWDFNWQGAYTFQRMERIPAGSTIHAIAVYDNTSNNPFNPHFPSQTVSWGDGTTDEMYLVGLSYVPYQVGDENILIGEDVTNTDELELVAQNQLFAPFPNPTNGEVVIDFYLMSAQSVNLEVFDLEGRLVLDVLENVRYTAGRQQAVFNTQYLSEGVYSIRLSNEQMKLTKTLVVAK